MSHITNINLIVKDLDAMGRTAKRLGLELVRNQKTFKWYGQFVGDSRPPQVLADQGYTADKYGTCDHVIRIPGNSQAYQIGLIKRSDGKGYMLAWDNWQGGFGLCKAAGYDSRDLGATKLRDWYSAEVTKKQMARQGFRVTLSQQERKVQVICNK